MCILKNLGLLGLMFATLVLFTAPLAAQAGDQPDWANCEMCKHAFEDMDLIMSCDYTVSDWSQGLIFNLSLKNPDLLPRLRAMEKQDEALSAKFIAMDRKASTAKLCSMCNQYLVFIDKGMQEERIETPTGSILIAKGGNPALIKELHSWGDSIRQAMASFDMSALAAESACSGDCDGNCAACAAKAKTECSGECDGDCAACAAKAKTECSGDCDGDCAACAAAATCSGDCTGDCPGCAAKAAGEKAVAQIPEFMLEEMKKCHLCKTYLDYPDMMTAAKMKVIDLKNGFIINSTVLDKKNLERYQELEKIMHVKIEDLKKEAPWDDAKKKICSFCCQFCELEREGAVMDWSLTDTGSVMVVIGKDPMLVQKIHTLGTMIKAYEDMSAFPEGDAK